MKEQVIPGLYDETLASTAILQTISEHTEDKVKKKKKTLERHVFYNLPNIRCLMGYFLCMTSFSFQCNLKDGENSFGMYHNTLHGTRGKQYI